MSRKILDEKEVERTKRAFELCDGNVTETARRLGLNRTTVRDRLISLGLTKESLLKSRQAPIKVYAAPAKTRVIIMTAMQDDSAMFPNALKNLEAYSAHRKGQLLIGGFTYNKALYTNHETRHAVFHNDAIRYMSNEIIQLAPQLVWYGDFNVLPTATQPLSGWETNTRDKWAVFPHAKIALKCIPSMPGTPGKQIMTTGVVTKPNYIKKNAGQKAEFHHTQGATIAEIKSDGTFFLRQLIMTHDGSFQDLDVLVKDGKILPGPRVEAITWGDIHKEWLDPVVAKVCWGFDIASGEIRGTNSMLDVLKPREQHFHDSFDFKARLHWTRNDPHERQKRNAENCNSVEDMLDDTAQFLSATQREWCKSVHISSNHNDALDRWLKSPDGQSDAKNAQIWHELNAAWHRAIRKQGDFKFEAFEYALRNREYDLEDVKFVRRGQSHLICKNTQPVECGLHADIGPRGSKGSAEGLRKIVERINGAHTHEPQILEGVYLAGTSSVLDIPYATKGPLAWHQSEIVTYENGKRAIITLSNGAFRA
jgi:Bacterial regulatory protein, Fis family